MFIRTQKKSSANVWKMGKNELLGPQFHTYRRRKSGEGMLGNNRRRVEESILEGPTSEEYIRSVSGDWGGRSYFGKSYQGLFGR